jgi:hypothetical protein
MTVEILLLFLGVFLVSFVVTWVWWVKVRVIFLQEELFIIRNRLWDHAKELNAFDDKAYKHARSHLNRCIKAAGFIDLSTVEYVAKNCADMEWPAPPSTKNTLLAEAIGSAYRESAIRIRNYLLLDTFPGRLYLLRAKFAGLIDPLHYTGKEPLNARVKEDTIKWIRSKAPESLSVPH